MFLDCLTFRLGLYSSHFGEVRGAGIEIELAEWQTRDPLKRMADCLVRNGSARNEDLARIEQEEEEKIEAAFDTVRGEK